MRKHERTNWLCWRIAPTGGPVPPAVPFHRTALFPDSRTIEQLRAETPGSDGIRHELVARIRAEIAAGTYDTDERWLAAEDRLVRAASGSR
jgi:hypothetical protein